MVLFLITAFQILVLLNPFAVLSTFLAMDVSPSSRERLKTVIRCGFAVMGAGVLLFFCGNLIFSLLGINIDLFKVGGGVILMICSISLVWGDNRKRRKSANSGEHGDIAVVPLAIPMAVGPGTSAGLIVIGIERSGFLPALSALLSLLLSVILLCALLASAIKTGRFLGQRGIEIITKLTGLFLSAIAAKMILEGVKSFLNM